MKTIICGSGDVGYSIADKLSKENFEICFHGFYHGIPGKNDNDEFRYLNYELATERFNAMKEIAKKAGVEKDFKMIFRPPAWKISSDAIRAARDFGITLLALDKFNPANTKCYGGEEHKKNDVVYMTSAPPFYPLKLEEKTEIVYHACEWDKNYLCKEKTKDLIIFLNNNKGNYTFNFLEDLLR